MKTSVVTAKRSAKNDRAIKVLFSLIETYLDTGKAVGSNTLKEAGFPGLSAATIRNYFAELEADEYLEQLHTSGGRIPTPKAIRLYIQEHFASPVLNKNWIKEINKLKAIETPEVAGLLQRAAETLSHVTNTAVFLLAPRFDHDFVIDAKLVQLDQERCLSIIITNFGLIRTEMLYSNLKLNGFRIKRLESYFHFRLKKIDATLSLEEGEEGLAERWYNEVMVRYVAGYSNFIEEEVYRTGMSKLLHYPDFEEAQTLASALSLFENVQGMRLLLRDCVASDHIKVWLENELLPFAKETPPCAVITVPYRINQKVVGAIGILGPIRLPYRQLIGTLAHFSDVVSTLLTQHVFKYKVTYRDALESPLYLTTEERLLLEKSETMLLEDQRK